MAPQEVAEAVLVGHYLHRGARIARQSHRLSNVRSHRGEHVGGVRHYAVYPHAARLTQHRLPVRDVNGAVFVRHGVPGIIRMQVGADGIVPLSPCGKGGFRLHYIAAKYHDAFLSHAFLYLLKE